jgi:uncharacterized membrane protein
MTKIQKIWLGIFLAMFVVPEVLFGPMLGSLGFFMHIKLTSILSGQLITDYPSVAYFVLMLESVGVVGLFAVINKKGEKKIKAIELINIILVVIAILLLFAWYITLSFDGVLK